MAKGINIKIETNAKKDVAQILLEGELTIDTLEKIIPDVAKAIDKYERIELSVKKVSELDLSCIQFFYSIKRTAETNNKEIKFDFNFSEQIWKIIEENGFYELKELSNN